MVMQARPRKLLIQRCYRKDKCYQCTHERKVTSLMFFFAIGNKKKVGTYSWTDDTVHGVMARDEQSGVQKFKGNERRDNIQPTGCIKINSK